MTVVTEKAESQDICFVPDGDYVRFLEEERGVGQMDGEIVHVSGEVLGRHRGTSRYTIGQRRGLGISWTEPLFVVGIDAEKRRVVVGEKQHLARETLEAFKCNWSIPLPETALNCRCRIRYRHHEVEVQVIPLGNDEVRVEFTEPQAGVTPGQAAVFYADDRVLGGGWIK